VTLDDLRRLAVARGFFTPTSLRSALDALGFVQADPIRAPARAQDLTLRHRVIAYRAGELERQYPELDVHEDVFVNYGFVTGALQALMHPRGGPVPWPASRAPQVRALLRFVRVRGPVHPREVDEHFSHGKVTNYWGGSSNATTHLLGEMHYRGLLRVVRRDAGIRVYAAHQHDRQPRDARSRRERIDALVDVLVRNHAPLPGTSLAQLVRRLRYAVPQWDGELQGALDRARRRLAHVRVTGVDWHWPADWSSGIVEPPDVVRLLAPFDPVVWDRLRFELLWNWAYRFEAYTPVAQRRFGYYALPLLWRDRVIGWANLTVVKGTLQPDIGYLTGRPPRERAFHQALDEELGRMRLFLGVDADAPRAKATAARRSSAL
jgi:uncharacterized protein YcaQ